jgi:hypothetical protein
MVKRAAPPLSCYETNIDINEERRDPARTASLSLSLSLGTDARRYETSPASEQEVYSDQGSRIDRYIDAGDRYSLENQPRGCRIKIKCLGVTTRRLSPLVMPPIEINDIVRTSSHIGSNNLFVSPA